MEKSKTPWENIHGGNSSFIDNLNKSPRRLEREKRIGEMTSLDLKCPCEKFFCFMKKIGIALLIGFIFLICYSLIN